MSLGSTEYVATAMADCPPGRAPNKTTGLQEATIFVMILGTGSWDPGLTPDPGLGIRSTLFVRAG